MTNVTGEGAKRVRFRNWRWWGILVAGVVAIVAGFEALDWIYGDPSTSPGKLQPDYAVAASIFSVLIFLIGAFAYHRIIDEQEERAALWGYTIGFYAICAGSMGWYLLALGGLVAMSSFPFVIFGGALLAIAIQLWLQYR